MKNSLCAIARFILLWVFFTFSTAQAQVSQSPEVARGLQWLSAQVQHDGSMAAEGASTATPLQVRMETAASMKLLSAIPAPLVDRIAGDIDGNTEYVARQIISLASAGRSVGTLVGALASRQNDDGGFGGAPGYASNPLDTAWVLLALNAALASDTVDRSAAVYFLLSAQDAGGGYAVSGNPSHPYVTSLVALALQSAPSNPGTLNALNRVNAWLLSQQQPDGSWGSVAETSVVYLALLGSVSDSALQTAVTAYLVSRQGADGSWGGDPFETALALRALVTQARPVPTTGSILLRVVDNGMGQPLAGVSAVVQNSSVGPAVSDATGKIFFAEVPAGAYTLMVSASGYADQVLSLSLKAGTTTDLGTIRMPATATKGILRGLVKDGATGSPLGGVTISVSGSAAATALTATDGTYSIPDLAPGAVIVSAHKEGYTSVGGAGTVVAGQVLVFSPNLPIQGQATGTTGAITGIVVDAASLVPLPGVAVMFGTTGKTTITAADGKFSIADIQPGTYPVSFSLTGYSVRSASVMVPAGATVDFGIVAMAKSSGTSVTLQGKVTDASSGKALGSATVKVLGTSLAATTDGAGSYRIENIPTGAVSLRFSASGYASETVTANFASAGDFRLDRALSLDSASNPSFVSLATDQPSYPAFSPVTVLMELRNNSDKPVEGAVVDITISDPQGQVLNTQEAIRIDADGVAQNHFTFGPNASTPVHTKWATQSYPPGTYKVKARVFQENVASGARLILAERTTTFNIEPSQTVLNLRVVPIPAFTNLNATEQQRFKVEATHQSNQPVNISFKYQFKSPGGTVLKEETASIALQPTELVGSYLSNAFEYGYTASGVYPVVLTSTGSVVPQSVVSGEIQVAPGIRVEPVQSVAPNSVTPDGDKRIRIQLQLKGVEQK